MKQFLKKNNIWVSAVIFLLGLAALFFSAVLPLKRDIQVNADEIQKKAIDDSLSKARISKIPEMQKTEDLLAESRNNLNIILSNDNEVDFIRKIETLADETGNRVELEITENATAAKVAPAKKDSVNNEDLKSKLLYDKYLPMQINLEGGYAEALNFIHRLENMQYYVTVLSFKMDKAESEENNESEKYSNSGLFSPGVSSRPVPVRKMILKTSLEVIIYLEK